MREGVGGGVIVRVSVSEDDGVFVFDAVTVGVGGGVTVMVTERDFDGVNEEVCDGDEVLDNDGVDERERLFEIEGVFLDFVFESVSIDSDLEYVKDGVAEH